MNFTTLVITLKASLLFIIAFVSCPGWDITAHMIEYFKTIVHFAQTPCWKQTTLSNTLKKVKVVEPCFVKKAQGEKQVVKPSSSIEEGQPQEENEHRFLLLCSLFCFLVVGIFFFFFFWSFPEITSYIYIYLFNFSESWEEKVPELLNGCLQLSAYFLPSVSLGFPTILQ